METTIENPSGVEKKPTGFFPSKLGKIAYWIEGKGKPIILLHSAGHDHQDFDSVLPELSAKYKVISIDWPGHGMSPNPEPSSSASAVEYAQIIPDLVKDLAPEGAVLIGNSIGGFASLNLALQRPELVKGLILVDSGGMNEPNWVARNFSALKGKVWFTGLVWNFFPNQYIKIKNRHTQSILSRIKERENIEGAKEVNAAIWKSFLDERHDLRAKVDRIKAPTLIVWGEFDPVIEAKIATQLHEKIQGSQIALLKTGHVPFAEDPKAFLQVTLPFLQTIY
ncbi:alpha/beta hydrolase [Leptospira langatensis]|uniref:Alpha/beta hydrolase n=2 Tax=Leptospira langatensis TaxID=2484983 RepID=A0A5F1ZVI7_9LEPT|nr:alpha/beta hydrolase [Leptospira langatensis]TGK00339.1 alpha/beta hydrolase [Leptospira langatensis]TGL41206.1 alpha/beta hydrolase [Leptospira langatensis]